MSEDADKIKRLEADLRGIDEKLRRMRRARDSRAKALERLKNSTGGSLQECSHPRTCHER